MNVKHSSETNEQYTPLPIIEMVRKVLERIHLDPATSLLANERVKAEHIYTLDYGAAKTFEEFWQGNVFLNPPGGTEMVLSGTGFRSNPVLFWSKLMHAWWVERSMNAAIFLGFTMEVLQTSQSVGEYPMLRFPFCVPRKRIAFDVPRLEKLRQLGELLRKAESKKAKGKILGKIAELEASDEECVSGGQPPHGNVLVLVPPLQEHHTGKDHRGNPWVAWGGEYTERFQDVFSELGYVRI